MISLEFSVSNKFTMLSRPPKTLGATEHHFRTESMDISILTVSALEENSSKKPMSGLSDVLKPYPVVPFFLWPTEGSLYIAFLLQIQQNGYAYFQQCVML